MTRIAFFLMLLSPPLLIPGLAHAVECQLESSEIWGTGFRIEYRVSNNKERDVNQWSVQLSELNGSIQTHWDSTLLPGASPLTLNNASWNGAIQPGGSVVFGIQGSKSGSFTPPTCVDAVIANMEVPIIDDTSTLETTFAGGFSWQPVAGAVRYEVQLFSLNEAGEPIELLSSNSTDSTSWGFGNSQIGHFGWRINQCDADDNCSGFSDFKKVVKYSLHAPKINSVTGDYEIRWQSPFSDSVLLENGVPVSDDASAFGSASFKDRESGTYVYSLSTITKTFTVSIDRFDPDINIDRSLFVHDVATLEASGITLADIFARLAAQLVEENQADPIDATMLFTRMWDAQNSAETSVGSGVTPCTTSHLDDPVDCPRKEAEQALQPSIFLNSYFPTAMVNRLDLRDRSDHSHCGEARIIFALNSSTPDAGGGRNFIIFESELPNPIPGDAKGCLPVAEFWHSLSDLESAATRGELLRDFYLNGLPDQNVVPVIHIDNFKEGSGQIRTNQFMEFAQGWNLREYKISTENNVNHLAVVTVKNNPLASFFDSQNGTEFLQQFSEGVLSLVGGISFISMPQYDDRFNNIESHANGPITENEFTLPFGNSRDSSFESRMRVILSNVRSDLSVDQLINRAKAMTCGGCHQPSNFGLTAPDAVGPGLSWPRSLSFVHVSETPVNGHFPLSPALTDVFLPDRLDVFETFLSTGAAPAPDTVVEDVDNTVESKAIDSGDRSG